MTFIERLVIVTDVICRLCDAFALPLAIAGLIAAVLTRTGGPRP